MRILYVAKHGSGGNDDEGAIDYALGQLGHEVVRIQECYPLPRLVNRYDFCLFHKWSDMTAMRVVKSVMPCVFWYFDLVDWPLDATLSSRCEARKRWMTEVTPLVDLGFITDGDWVERDRSGKLVVLRQGADERVVGFGREQERDVDILFVGGVKGCGVQRQTFVDQLSTRYGPKLTIVQQGVYREELRDLVARSKVVVCPDSPVTKNYWSNRLYVMMGFGACLLHPSVDISFMDRCGMGEYGDRGKLFSLVDHLLGQPELCQIMRQEALATAKAKHLYRHRCEELIRVVKERLGI